MSLFRTFICVTLASLAALLAGCASGPSTRVDRDPAVDLKAYRTFSFYDQAPGRATYSTIMSARLKQATRQALERLGYTYSDSQPDLRVNIIANVVNRQELRSTPGVGPFGYRAWGASSIETVDYRQGTLVIDMVDASKRALVWRGVAEGRIGQKASRDPGAAVDLAVKEIFANFPNGSAG